MDKLKTFIRDYGRQQLHEHDLNPDPIAQFKSWLEQAFTTEPREPNAMTLATVDSRGRPSARVMLLKEVNAEGFVFFTNYTSRKGNELIQNPHAALVFWWPYCERQVRIEGRVEKVSPEASDEYFASRGRDSRLGAHASKQSSVLKTREELHTRFHDLQAQYSQTDTIPRPAHWGGFILKPEAIEFWQGGAYRLHDRIRFEKRENGSWRYFRLAP